MAAGRSGSATVCAKAGPARPSISTAADREICDIALPYWTVTSPMSYHDLIRAAQARIAGHVRRTPVIHVDARPFGLALAHPLALKLELLQHTGSFKPRGAFNNL